MSDKSAIPVKQRKTIQMANVMHAMIAHITDLVGDRQHVVVARDVDMQHVELVTCAQVIRDARERRAARLGHAVVDDDQIVHSWAEQLVLQDRGRHCTPLDKHV